MFRLIEHTADMGIEAYGSSRTEAIEEVANGLTELVFGEVSASPDIRNEIVICAEDPVELLVATLNEIVYQIEMDSLVPAGLLIESINDNELRGCITGETFDAERHNVERQVKSVTYHRACLEETSGGYHARVYVDL